MLSKSTTYLILAIILLLLSAAGVYWFLQLPPPAPAPIVASPTHTPLPTLTSTPTPLLSPSPTSSISATPFVKATPTPRVSTPSAQPTTTSGIQTLQSLPQKFQVSYSSSRQLYQDKEDTGDRYTLASSQGNFAIHVGPDWSWVNTSRQFSSSFIVAGQNTFVYEISTQKIVDFEANGLKYTVQCIHNGLAPLKTECDKLLTDFTLLK